MREIYPHIMTQKNTAHRHFLNWLLSAGIFLSASFALSAAETASPSPPQKSAAAVATPETAAPALAPVGEVPNTACDAPAGTWTLVALPDTQYYVEKFPQVFFRQTQWIAQNKKAWNILFVVHEGDITNRNLPEQWDKAHQAMDILSKSKIPYAVVPGNHDLGDGGKTNNRSTFMSDYFSAADYKDSASVGYFTPGKMENSWQTFQTPWGPFMVLALEFGPRAAVVKWANEAVSAHPECQVILVTHAYLMDDSGLSDINRDGRGAHGNPRKYGIKDDVSDGADLWKHLVSKHPNFRLVLNGHVTGAGVGYLVSVGSGGQRVHQMLANFQNSGGKSGVVKPAYGYGGGGFLRLLEFLPDKKTVRVRTYSPWFNEWLTSPAQQFTLQW